MSELSVRKPENMAKEDFPYKCVARGEFGSVAHQDATLLESKMSFISKVPALIVGLYTSALIFASGHYIMFRLLNATPVDSVLISQSYVSAGSIALTFAFKTCIVASLWSALTQWLWYNLRRQETSVGTIEDLTKMAHDPLSIFSRQAFHTMPLLSFCALATWMIGIAAIFPPGALTIRSLDFTTSQFMDLPVFDPEYRGDGTVRDLSINALFVLRDTGEYVNPKPSVTRLAKKTILLQEPVNGESPCGQNCSYSVQIPGPSYDCYPGLETGNMTLRDNMVYYGNLTTHDEDFIFEANWTSYSNYSGNAGLYAYADFMFESITCVVSIATYDLYVVYLNGRQSVTSSLVRHEPLSSRNLMDLALFDPQVNRTANGTLLTHVNFNGSDGNANLQANALLALTDQNSFGYIFAPHVQAMSFDDSMILPGGTNVTTALKLSSIRAMHESLILAIGGGSTGLASFIKPPEKGEFAIMGDDWENKTKEELQNFDRNTSSLILDTKMASFSGTDPTAVWLNITAESLQELLTNITISILTMPNTSKSINVTRTTTLNTYSFARPMNVIVPYAVTMFGSFFVMIVGLLMLWKNGAPASVGSFLEIVCSTQGSESLSQLARRGNYDNKEELKLLKVIYGNLGDEGATTLLGFGTAEEVRSL